MKKTDIDLVLFDTTPIAVSKVQYKDSIYFIAEGKDITDYVLKIHGELDYVDIHSLQNVINVYLIDNPEAYTVDYKTYNLVLTDDPNTSQQFVEQFCTSVLGLTRKRSHQVVQELNSNKHESVVGTYTREIASTLRNILYNANHTLQENLGSYIEEVKPQESAMQKNFGVIQTLIERDYPEDI